MLTVTSDTHSKHNAKHEFQLGYFIPFQESPARVENILAAINNRKLGQVLNSSVDHGLDPILAVHTQAYVDYLRGAYGKWIEVGGNPDGVFPDVFAVREFANRRRNIAKADAKASQDTQVAIPHDGGALGKPGYYCFDMTGIIVEGTYQAAYDAVQVALTALDHLLRNLTERATFALCRPPGHHAHADLCGGYCFFNNAAIATRYAISKHDLKRVAILDIDYHHGNGTQEIFYEDKNPLYVSLHGAIDYPYYWGSAEEVGAGEGRGYNVNLPLPLGTQDQTYLQTLETAITKHIIPYDAELLIVSLGVDTFKDDPIGGFFLTSDCYTAIGQAIASIGKPTLFVMEGGYAIQEIGVNVTNVLSGFRDAEGKI